jgi:glycosyltransferase involved in cell wall biosynthesis
MSASATDRTQIVLFNGSPLESVGGVQIFSRALLRSAFKRGYTAVALTSAQRGEPLEGRVDGFPVVRFRSIPFLNGRFPIPFDLLQMAAAARFAFSSPHRLFIVQTRLYPLSLIGAALSIAARHRCIVIEHGSGHIPTGNRIGDALSVAYEHVATKAMRFCGCRFYAVSKASSKWLEHFGIKNTPTISNGVDDALFDMPRKERPGAPFVIVFAGRLIAEKGVGDLLTAFESLEADYPGEFRLEIIGNGTLTPMVEAHAKRGSGIGLGFNRGLIEAGALARAIVATRKGAIDLIEDGITVVQVASSDPSAIASALVRLRDDPAFARYIGENMRKRVCDNHRWCTIFERFWAAEMPPELE